VSQRKPLREGWARALPATAHKGDIRYEHSASGWIVQHCGHPTANWPYYLIDPEHPHDYTVSATGRGWRRLCEAMEAAEDVLAGRCVTTDRRCRSGTRVVVG
jgi:hypothetical protein